jgi:hypothetical protein
MGAPPPSSLSNRLAAFDPADVVEASGNLLLGHFAAGYRITNAPLHQS